MSDDTVKITINDQELEVAPGSMLIDVADKSDIHIPRFCYHKKLSIAANCRMCLVEVEKAPKPMPACATPVTDGMKVWTRSEKALAAQKDTMEFLLINHPLDCPICDQGGECELQDLSMAFGGSSSSYHEIKRVVADKDIGELVATEMTRCIQCTRCVRFGEEIAGMRELGATGRGDRMEIGTFVEKSLSSELSGNIIDICPVGALTAKPSRYHSRAWEMQQTAGIGSHDCVGSAINLHTFKQKLVRVVAGENESVNECWISDRDRFSYQGVYAKDRVESPMVKQDGHWKEVSWDDALDAVVASLQAANPERVGVLASPRATLEELYLLQKSMRAIGVNSIDHRLRQSDFNDQDSMGLFPWLGVPIDEIENQNALMLIGSNVRQDQPMINHRIRKAALKGAAVVSVNSRQLDFNYSVEQRLSAPADLVATMANLAKASFDLAGNKIPAGLADLLGDTKVTKSDKAIIKQLGDAENAIVFLGNAAVQSPAYSTLRALSAVIADNCGAKLGYLAESANTAGAWLAGAIPHRKEAGEAVENAGHDVGQMFHKGKQTYVLLDVEPTYDCDDPQQALAAMQQADKVIAIAPYASGNLLSFADIILPSAAFGETSGTYVNAEGRWQSFRAAAKNYANARPAWKILRVLGNKLGIQGFDYVSSADVRDELEIACDAVPAANNAFEVSGIYTGQDKPGAGKFQRIGDVAEFCADSLVRRATALQKSAPWQEMLWLNANEVEKLGLQDAVASITDENTVVVNVKQGDETVDLPLKIDASIPDGCALLMAGTQAGALLGSAFGELEIGVIA